MNRNNTISHRGYLRLIESNKLLQLQDNTEIAKKLIQQLIQIIDTDKSKFK